MDWRIRDFLFLPKIIAVGHVKCTGKNFPVNLPSPFFSPGLFFSPGWSLESYIVFESDFKK